MPETLRFADHKLLTVLPRGGDLFARPVQPLTPKDMEKLLVCAARWPAENRDAVEAIRQVFAAEPACKQFLACETAFFTSLPAATAQYALPQGYAGLRRFGADGLFHAWIAGEYSQFEKVLSIHLSGNTTLAAIRAGQAVDTSAGYSLLEGLPGLTTCGDIDPSLLLFLNEHGLSVQQIRDLLYTQSGWQSFTPRPLTFTQFLNADEKELELPRSMYFHALIKQIGAMLSVLGGAGRIVFGAETAEKCEPFVAQVRCHFNEKALKFELIEVSRAEVLRELASQISLRD